MRISLQKVVHLPNKNLALREFFTRRASEKTSADQHSDKQYDRTETRVMILYENNLNIHDTTKC